MVGFCGVSARSVHHTDEHVYMCKVPWLLRLWLEGSPVFEETVTVPSCRIKASPFPCLCCGAVPC